MKVIKPGRPQQGWAKEFECTGIGNQGGGCGAILLVEQDDLFSTASSSYDGSTERFVTFECPGCGVLTDILDTPKNLGRLLSHKAWKKSKLPYHSTAWDK